MIDALFTFAELLQRVVPGFLGARWKVVRHLDNRKGAPDLVELLHLERDAREFYQADQINDVFSDCEGTFSFVGLPGRRALFIRAYLVRGVSFARPLVSQLRPGQCVRRDKLLRCVAAGLGYTRLTAKVKEPLLSAVRSAIRRGEFAPHGKAMVFRPLEQGWRR